MEQSHQLVKNFPAFYGTRRPVTAFTKACHLRLAVLTAAEFSKIFAVWQPRHLIWHNCQQARILLILPLVPILSQIKPVHTPLSHFWRSILVRYSHLPIGLPIGFFHSDFPTKTWYAALFFTYVLHTSHIWFFFPCSRSSNNWSKSDSFFWADQTFGCPDPWFSVFDLGYVIHWNPFLGRRALTVLWTITSRKSKRHVVSVLL